MEKKKALGRGMASLIGDASLTKDDVTPPKSYFYCDIENITSNKDQPRKRFNDETLQELAASIKERGILQPVLVRRLSEFKYELIAGERRWRAAQKAGLKQVPAIIRESTKSELLEDALIENIQREDLDSIEEAQAYTKLMEEYKYTQEQLAKKLGKNRSTIANTIRLMELPEMVRDMVAERKISAGHARALLSIKGSAEQLNIAHSIVNNGWSVRKVESLVKRDAKKVEAKKLEKRDPYITLLEEELSQHFKAKTRVSQQGKRGKIEIEFYGEEELNRVVALLKA